MDDWLGRAQTMLGLMGFLRTLPITVPSGVLTASLSWLLMRERPNSASLSYRGFLKDLGALTLCMEGVFALAFGVLVGLNIVLWSTVVILSLASAFLTVLVNARVLTSSKMPGAPSSA